MSKVRTGNRSLTQRLLIYLLVPVLLTISIAVSIAIVVASRSVNLLFDQQLKNNTEILLAFLHYEYAEEEDDDDDLDSAKDSDDDHDEELVEIVSEIESRQGLLVSYRLRVNDSVLFTSDKVRFFPACDTGFSNFDVDDTNNAKEIVWRCYRKTQTLANSGIPIDVEFFEPVTQRHQAIYSLLIKSFSPIFLLPVVVLLVAWWAVHKGMKSLMAVSREVAKRSVGNLDRIPREGQPTELLPIVDSVNGLLAGVELGVLREKQFTDDAAHELRTPITSIKMLEQLIRRDNTDPDIVEYLDNLRDSADHSSVLIEQLLKLARLQSTQALEKNTLDLHELVSSQLGILSPQITAKFLAVDFTYSQGPISIDAHEASLSLLINNLLVNAVNFSDEHGTLYIRLEEAMLSVEDEGPGIHEEDRLRLFDRFYRAPSTRKTQGTGLGLSLAKSVADAHGFTLTVVEPNTGRGAHFVLHFGDSAKMKMI